MKKQLYDDDIVLPWQSSVSVPSSELGPAPLPQVCPPPPLDQKGESNTSLRVGGWADPIRTTGQKAWPSVYVLCDGQGVTKRCRLSCLINDALVPISAQMEGKWGRCGVSVDENSWAHGAQVNFGYLTSYLTYGDGVPGKNDCSVFRLLARW
jgi:hypothetical protein